MVLFLLWLVLSLVYGFKKNVINNNILFFDIKLVGDTMKLDKWLFIDVIILMLFGLLMIYSASSVWAEYKFGNSLHYSLYQGIFIIISLFLIVLLSKVNPIFYYQNANKLLIIALTLLILVLIPGIGIVRNGSRSWFGIGGFGIQPSEFAKLALIIFTSKYLEKSNKLLKDYKKGVFPILGILLLVFGLIMLEPDFGTGMILVISVIAIMFVAGVDMKFFLILGILGVIGIVFLIIIAPYRMDRITSFIDPWSDPLGTGFQIIQSLYAIGPGGLLGMGLFNSRQKHFYLPEPQTDFIFSIISEELGILGVIVVVLLFIILLYRSFKISLNCSNKFLKYLSFGLTFQIIIQTIMNLSVVIGLIPVTGVTLPFLSYGGSSLLISSISVGIILSISKEEKLM